MRKNLKKYVGKVITVTAVIGRKGYVNHGSSSHINLVLCDVRTEAGKLLSDHTWVPMSEEFTRGGCYYDEMVIVTARVGTYSKNRQVKYNFDRIYSVVKVAGPCSADVKVRGRVRRSVAYARSKTESLSKAEKRRVSVLSSISNKTCRLVATASTVRPYDNTITLGDISLAGDSKILAPHWTGEIASPVNVSDNGDKVSILAKIKPYCHDKIQNGLGAGYDLDILHIERLSY